MSRDYSFELIHLLFQYFELLSELGAHLGIVLHVAHSSTFLQLDLEDRSLERRADDTYQVV